jgi:hypothetical protein
MSESLKNPAENQETNKPARIEISEKTSRSELLTFLDQRAESFTEIATAAGVSGDIESISKLQGGSLLLALRERIENDPYYNPDEADVIAGNYIDADIAFTRNRHTIDDTKILAGYAHRIPDDVMDENRPDAAVAIAVEEAYTDLENHAKYLRYLQRKGVGTQRVQDRRADRLQYTIPPTLAPLKTYSNVENNKESHLLTIDEVIRYKNGLSQDKLSAKPSDAENSLLGKQMRDKVRDAGQSAKALLVISHGNKSDFLNENYFPNLPPAVSNEQVEDIKKVHEAFEDVDDVDEEDVASNSATKVGAAPEDNPRDESVENDEKESAELQLRRLQERRAAQQIRVDVAAEELRKTSIRRSKTIFNREEVDAYGIEYHNNFAKEVYALMQFERPPILDDPDATAAEKNAVIAKYAFDKYHEVTLKTVDEMGGEKDPKKRKRNARLLRLGGAGLGFVLGGPAGMAIGGAIGLGISKGLDSEMKNRERLKYAVQQGEAQFAADDYLNVLDRKGEVYDPKSAFEAATGSLMSTFEAGLVRRRRFNIGKASLQGAAWTAGTIFVAHEAVGALQYTGDQAYQAISRASWSGTGVPWDGGLNPNFNYTMHEKPVSMKALTGLWSVATHPVTGVTLGAAILAGLGGAKLKDNGYDAVKKKKSTNKTKTPANA